MQHYPLAPTSLMQCNNSLASWSIQDRNTSMQQSVYYSTCKVHLTTVYSTLPMVMYLMSSHMYQHDTTRMLILNHPSRARTTSHTVSQSISPLAARRSSIPSHATRMLIGDNAR